VGRPPEQQAALLQLRQVIQLDTEWSGRAEVSAQEDHEQ
jgi:hypothetical protein